MRPPHRLALALFAGSIAAVGARAQDIFSVPGHPRLEPTGLELDGRLLFIDRAGFVWEEERDGMACRDPDHPEAPPRTLFGSSGRTQYETVLPFRGHDGGAHLVVGDPNGGFRFFAGRCDDPPNEDGTVGRELTRLRYQDSPFRSEGPGPQVRVDRPYHSHDRVFDASPEGRYCLFFPKDEALVFGPGLHCLDPSTDPPSVHTLFTADALARWVPDDPHAGWLVVGPGYAQDDRWQLDTYAWLADGRLALVAEHRWSGQWQNQTKLQEVVRTVLMWTPDASPAVLFGPVRKGWPDSPEGTTGGVDPLAGLERLVWDPGRQMVWAFVTGWDFGGWEIPGGGEGEELGWSGHGLRAMPLSGGAGYLPLTAAIAPHHVCDGRISSGSLPICYDAVGTIAFDAGPDGALYVTVPRSTAPGRATNPLLRLSVDDDALDLDGDGLAAAEEARLGSSDRHVDGDGGGTPDGREVLFGHDPTDPADDTRDLHAATGHRVMTRELPPGLAELSDDLIPSIGQRGPICTFALCIDRDGTRYPNPLPDGVDKAIKAADGEHLYGYDGDRNLVRAQIRDGVWEIVASAEELAQHLAPDRYRFEGELFPVDGDRVWIAPPEGDRKVARLDASGLRVVFDLEQARCDSGLGPCDPHAGDGHVRLLPLHDLYDPFWAVNTNLLTPIGPVEARDAFLVGVIGKWDRWLLLVGADGEVAIVERTHGLAGARGEDLSDWADGGAGYPFVPPGAFVKADGGLDTWRYGMQLNPWLDASFAMPSIWAVAPLTGGWGDVLIQQVCCGTWEDGVWTSFVEPARAAPGDVLLLETQGRPRRAGDGAMLYRLPPRGGRVPLWGARVPWIHQAEGFSLRPSDGLICIADSRAFVHLIARDPLGDWLPIDLGRVAPGIRDCNFDRDGRLLGLFADPPRLDALDLTTPGAAWQRVETLDPERLPLELIRARDTWRILYEDERLEGALVLADGREVVMTEQQYLWLDGQEWLGPLYPLRISVNADHPPSGIPFRLKLVELPDGSVGFIARDARAATGTVGLYGTFEQAHPDGRTFVPRTDGQFTMFSAEAMNSVLVVPGGRDDDPWSGPRLPAPDTSADASDAADAGNVEGAELAEPSARGDDDGCHGGAAPLGWLVLLAATARRPRRNVSRVTSRSPPAAIAVRTDDTHELNPRTRGSARSGPS